MSGFFEGFEEWLEEGGGDDLDTLVRQWERIARVLPELGDVGREVNWVNEQFTEIGVNIKAIVLFAMKLAMIKNEPPMTFTSQFTSGYLAGWIGAMEKEGHHPLDRMETNLPDDHDPGREQGDAIVGYPIEINILDSPREVKDALKMGLDGVGDILRKKAREIGQDFTDPEDDWAPVMMVVTDKELGMLGIQIPDSEQHKTMLFRTAIPMGIKQSMNGKPQTVGMITSAWSLDAVGNPDHQEWLQNRGPHDQIADHPDRTESLMLYLADKQTQELWTAKILRDGEQAPALAEWVKQDMLPQMQTGRIPQMMKKILS